MSRRIPKNGKKTSSWSITLTKRQARALFRVIDYVFREEEKHFYTEEPEHRGRHIFHDIRVAALAIRYTSIEHLNMLDQQDAEYQASRTK